MWNDWLHEAEASEPNDPNAAALATSTSDGQPSVRMVLVKSVEDGAFSFFTNQGSQKGTQLHANPNAALCFHWKSLRRQVRVEGSVNRLADDDVDRYFHTRSRRSQIGAAVSRQSHPLPTRAQLESEVAAYEREHPGEIPRPPFWQGFAVLAEKIEFWADGPDRLHDRMLFTRADGSWSRVRLYP